MSDALPDRAWMTPLLNRIADVAGERAALILGRDKACQQIYVPNKAPAGHWLAELVGYDAATSICDHFGGQHLEIPPALAGEKRRRAAILAEMIDKGYSNNRITQMTGVSRKTVKLHRRRRGPQDDPQGSLF